MSTIQLFNPYHDEKGQFTSKAKAVKALKKDMAGMDDAKKEGYLRKVVEGKQQVGGEKPNLRHQEVAQKMLAVKDIKADIGKPSVSKKKKPISGTKYVSSKKYKDWKKDYDARQGRDYKFYQKEEAIWSRMYRPEHGMGRKKGAATEVGAEAAEKAAKQVRQYGKHRHIWQAEIDREWGDGSAWEKEYYDSFIGNVAAMDAPDHVELEDSYNELFLEDNMPAALDRCVTKLLAKWSKNPASRPTPREKDGKPQEAKQQAFAICTAAQKEAGNMAERLETIALEGTGMTLMGVAVTNRPHLKGLPPVKIVQRKVGGEDVEMLRIPLLLQGIFNHSKGRLVFNQRVFGRLSSNLKDNIVGQDVCVDSRHNPDWGALGWIGNGFPGTGLNEEDDILVAYAIPTAVGREKVEQKLFRYASAELHANFQHPRIGSALEAAKLSTDEIDTLTLEQITEEDTMPEKDKDTAPTIEEVTQLSEQLADEQEKREALEIRLATLEEGRQKAEALEARLKLAEERLAESETRLAQSDKEKYVALVDSTMTKAEHYRDEEGRAHPKVLLDTARSLLLMEPIKVSDDDVIKLEHEEDKEPTMAQTHKFYHDAVVFLLENLPGLVPTQPGTHAEEDRLSHDDDKDKAKAKEEFDEFVKLTGGPTPAKEED